MTKDEALRLALEALSEAHYVVEHRQDVKKREQAITAIKAALEAKDEPVAFVKGWNCGRLEVIVRSLNQRFEIDQPLYTNPPQRTWVTLTEDEIVLISADCAASHQHTDIHFAKAIEAALKAKNT